MGTSPDRLYDVAPDPHRKLHEMLGAPWPCESHARFDALWEEMLAYISRPPEHVEAGEYTAHSEQLTRDFDADPSLAMAAHCVVLHLLPEKIVETGVARGVTSRFLLEGLRGTGGGHLWSIDLPHTHTKRHDQLGAAVPEQYRGAWTLRLGTSAALLEPLLAELGEIDLFVHDSLHTTRNVRFELDRAWTVLRPGGVILLDDVHMNFGFRSFVDDHAPLAWFAGRDTRRAGLWGMAVKP
jgi:predicted O-methyltransferase YrrM